MKIHDINYNKIIMQTQGVEQNIYGKPGDIVEGLVLENQTKLKLRINGQEVIASSGIVPTAIKGEILQFRIDEILDNTVVLKPVQYDTKNQASTPTTNVLVKGNISAFINRFEKDITKNPEASIEEIKASIQGIIEKLTPEDYQSLMDEGIDILKLDIDGVALLVSQRKMQPTKHEVSDVDILMNRYQHLHGNKTFLKRVISKLRANNLPVNAMNINKVISAMERALETGRITDSIIHYVLDNELDPTIDNVYKARHSEHKNTSYALYTNENVTQVWESLKGQVEKLLQKNNLEVNSDNMQTAKWLLENQLPLTDQTIKIALDLKNTSSESQSEILMDNIIECVKNGREPEQAWIVEDYNKISVREAIRTIHQVTDRDIGQVILQEEKMNLENLKKEASGTMKEISSIEEELRFITAKRNLEEIRLKLTLEAGRKLIQKGIKLETDELQRIVDSLRSLEEDYLRQTLRQVGVEDTQENVEQLHLVESTRTTIRNMPIHMLTKVDYRHTDITLSQLHEMSRQVVMDVANEQYETYMTQPRTDLGDSIHKAFRQVDHILDELNLPITEANQRAVRILGYSEMPITAENIQGIKKLDQDVQYVVANMHPIVTAHIIKAGINPMHTNIETLIGQIDKLHETLGITTEQKYSEFLWKMDQDHSITPEERKKFIGIYRLLHAVEKTDGKALGLLVKQEREITLDNLLTAMRLAKHKGIDISVDDGFGALEQLNFETETLTNQLENWTTDSLRDSRQTVYELIKNITPQGIKELTERMGDDFMKLPLETLNQVFKNTEEDATDYIKEQLERLVQLGQDAEGAVSLLKDYKLPMNLKNLLAAQLIVQQEDSLFKKVRDALLLTEQTMPDDFEDYILDKETIQAQYEQLNGKLEQAREDLLTQDIGAAKIMNRGAKLTEIGHLRESISMLQELGEQAYFQVPIVLKGELTQLNIQLLQGNGEEPSMSITISSSMLGNVVSDFYLRGGTLHGEIKTDSEVGLSKLIQNQSQLLAGIENMGLNIEDIHFHLERRDEVQPLTKDIVTTPSGFERMI